MAPQLYMVRCHFFSTSSEYRANVGHEYSIIGILENAYVCIVHTLYAD